MNRRMLQSITILGLSLTFAGFFIVFPQWQIEHPSDSALILRSERHWLWRAPAHAHVDPAAIAIPVIAIAIVVAAMLIVLYHE